MRLSIVIDCADPHGLAQFWGPALGYGYDSDVGPCVVLVHPDGPDAGPVLVLQRVDEPKRGKNRVHIDLHAGRELDDEVARLTGLGASRRSDEIEEDGFRWVVMNDPAGNEFCVVRDPGEAQS